MSRCQLTDTDEDVYRKACSECTLCGLHKERTGQPVIWRGNKQSRVALVGLGPGKIEEETGIPFEGPAGNNILEPWLNYIHLTRDDLYITNVTKCRYTAPLDSKKQNLTPTAEMLTTCADAWLSMEIEQLNPDLVIIIGTAAGVGTRLMVAGQPIGPLLGTSHNVFLYGRTRCVFYLRHPASLLYARGYNTPDKWINNKKYQQLRQEYVKCFNRIKALINSIDT